MHDWLRVDAGIYHAMHTGWSAEIQKALNGGLLPDGYYALIEQHAGQAIADILTLHASAPADQPLPAPLPPSTSGGIALADAPPKVRHKQVIEPVASMRRRSLAVRHVSGHRLIAILEIVSPSNKDRRAEVVDFAEKVEYMLRHGVHVLVVDPILPGVHDPHGIHEIIQQCLESTHEPYVLPAEEPLTVVSYTAGPRVQVYLEHAAIGAPLPDMPLFLTADRYVDVPLEATYQAAYVAMPAHWRNILESA